MEISDIEIIEKITEINKFRKLFRALTVKDDDTLLLEIGIELDDTQENRRLIVDNLLLEK